MQEIVVRLGYPVRFTHGIFDVRNPVLRDAVAARARVLVVVDGGLVEAQPSIPAAALTYCRAHADRLELVAAPLVVPGGEAIKNDHGPVDAIRSAIDVHRIDRHAYVVAIGGGAVLDAVGYAAATAHRGVRLIRVPSTVLAQGDSAVGVKNGVNDFGKKNFVGTFAAPHAVLNDLDLLLTLSDRDWRAGISEAIKVALIRDAAFFAWIEEHADALVDRSPDAMARLVHRSAELHLDHIASSGDPFELGSARPLDFGHWAAHKLEALTHHELRHGEAVAVGIAQDCAYAQLVGRLAPADLWRVIGALEAVGLPTWHGAMTAPGPGGRPAVLDGLEEFREHLGGRLTITLIDRVGSAFEVHELDERLVLEASALLRRHGEQGALSA
ncbi:MAG: 3-dehydroquinate synthase [Solirubrobacteraceae bacterium]|nr:3-dehydroquinate synthase [Solirubrobacteraceae bacterium]MEA2138042.1 3-dehydroquinate synthase [Solirubrobacteraceae bacterium]